MADDPLCAYCQMPLSMHCRGGVEHADNYKGRGGTIRCRTRHCLAPLCDCVNFVEPAKEKKPDETAANAPPAVRG